MQLQLFHSAWTNQITWSRSHLHHHHRHYHHHHHAQTKGTVNTPNESLFCVLIGWRFKQVWCVNDRNLQLKNGPVCRLRGEEPLGFSPSSQAGVFILGVIKKIPAERNFYSNVLLFNQKQPIRRGQEIHQTPLKKTVILSSSSHDSQRNTAPPWGDLLNHFTNFFLNTLQKNVKTYKKKSVRFKMS